MFFLSNISNRRERVSAHLQPANREVKKTTRDGVFSTKFEMFGNVVKN